MTFKSDRTIAWLIHSPVNWTIRLHAYRLDAKRRARQIARAHLPAIWLISGPQRRFRQRSNRRKPHK